MATQPLAPPKVKAFLASINERLLLCSAGTTTAADTAADSTPTTDGGASRDRALYDALLRLELLQRGVLLLPPAATPTAPTGSKNASGNASTAVLLLTAVQTHAGKALLLQSDDSGVLPPPLAAGACVIAGRVAEQLARHHPTAGGGGGASSAVAATLVVPEEEREKERAAAWRDAVARCQQVQDDRFWVLLQLADCAGAGAGAGAAGDADRGSSGSATYLAAHCFYAVAEGYYLRAATAFQPDAPPAWKRAWDCVAARKRLERQQQQEEERNQPASATANDDDSQAETTSTSNPEASWEAIAAVTNLLRIARQKENAKRAAELSLVLADCYLDAAAAAATATDNNATDNNSTSDGTTNNNQQQLWRAVRQAFLRDVRPIVLRESPYPGQALERAAQCCCWNDGGDDGGEELRLLSPANCRYGLVLRLRVRAAQREAAVAAAAAADRDRAQNRATAATNNNKSSSTSAAVPSLEACRVRARRRVLAEADDADLRERAVAVRDRVWLAAAKANDDATAATASQLAPACRVLAQHVQYLHERAQAVARGQTADGAGWVTLADFLVPLLQQWNSAQENVENGTFTTTEDPTLLQGRSNEELRLMETSFVSLVVVEWMLCGSSGSHRSKWVFPVHLWQSSHAFLQQLADRRRATERASETKSAVGGDLHNESSPAHVALLRLEHAHASLSALLALAQSDGGSQQDTEVLRQITATATARSRTASNNALDAELGSSFLEFLVCWSGFHRQPWPFCNQPEARSLVAGAQSCLQEAHSMWGRPVSLMEGLLLKVAKADAEGVSFDGGLSAEALENYKQVLEAAAAVTPSEDRVLADTLVARCYAGIAQLIMRESNLVERLPSDLEETASAIAQKGLTKLEAITIGGVDEAIHLWRSSQFAASTVRFQVSICRRLIADALLRSGNTLGAQSFLEDAVKDAPDDAGAAFSLGSFRLRLALFEEGRTPEKDKAAQVQLLQAAKLDANKAGPFALLGYWYECKKDTKRALGCYSKALLLDPSHPVAGRGVIRLAPASSLKKVFDKAIASGSAVVGWAWHAVALQKAMVDGEDNMAVVALLNALRCRDLDCPYAEPLSEFYSTPVNPELPSKMELSICLSDLAACYYRLGRYTASIRSYHSAITEAGDRVPSSLLCSCAQVEMELGLFEEAAGRFSSAIEISDPASGTYLVALYGRGVALASLAQRDNQDGKSGLARERIQQAVEGCQKMASERQYACVQKLVGDLYTFAATLPPDVFGESNSQETRNEEALLRSQLSFISKGEQAFRDAMDLVEGTSEESNVLRASLLTDAGANLLHRAYLLSSWEKKGLHSKSVNESSKTFERAAITFQRAIDVCPTFAQAWCGYGCAMAQSEPLLSQHAFSRSLELDNLSPDSYANLGFLLTDFRKFTASTKVSDALTEVADTPMMWINRAFILEYEARLNLGQHSSRENVQQAADAYRAALQVVKHPSAMLGLAMTCRAQGERLQSSPSMVYESQNCTTEYLGVVGQSDVPTFTFNGVLSIESAVRGSASHMEEKISEGQDQVMQGVKRLENEDLSDDQSVTLDSRLFREVTAKCASPAAGAQNYEADTTMSLGRQVLNDPNRGELWVQLAKEFASNGSVVPAEHAARKGTSIIMQQLSGLLAMPSGSLFVSSEDLSDALWLKYWLGNLDEAKVKEESFQSQSSVDLQRALLINPGNQMARAAMMEETMQTIVSQESGL